MYLFLIYLRILVVLSLLKSSAAGFHDSSLVWFSLLRPLCGPRQLRPLCDPRRPLILTCPFNVHIFKCFVFDSDLASHVFLGLPPLLGVCPAAALVVPAHRHVAPQIRSSALPRRLSEVLEPNPRQLVKRNACFTF